MRDVQELIEKTVERIRQCHQVNGALTATYSTRRDELRRQIASEIDAQTERLKQMREEFTHCLRSLECEANLQRSNVRVQICAIERELDRFQSEYRYYVAHRSIRDATARSIKAREEEHAKLLAQLKEEMQRYDGMIDTVRADYSRQRLKYLEESNSRIAELRQELYTTRKAYFDHLHANKVELTGLQQELSALRRELASTEKDEQNLPD